MKERHNPSACPCGGIVKGASFAACCQPYLEGREVAPTAEHLMRSRYTAYTMGATAYLLATWHPDTRPPELAIDPPGTPHAPRWLDLAVHSHTQLSEDRAQVMFTARYRVGGRAQRLKEHSRFVRQDGQWFYAAGDVDFNATPQ